MQVFLTIFFFFFSSPIFLAWFGLKSLISTHKMDWTACLWILVSEFFRLYLAGISHFLEEKIGGILNQFFFFLLFLFFLTFGLKSSIFTQNLGWTDMFLDFYSKHPWLYLAWKCIFPYLFLVSFQDFVKIILLFPKKDLVFFGKFCKFFTAKILTKKKCIYIG